MNRLLLALIPGGNVVAVAGTVAGGLFRFATSTIGLVLFASVIAYGAGHHQAEKKCEAAALAARLAATQADLNAANDAATMAAAQAAEIDADDRANKEKVDALAADLRKRQGRHCGLSGGDARRLRELK